MKEAAKKKEGMGCLHDMDKWVQKNDMAPKYWLQLLSSN